MSVVKLARRSEQAGVVMTMGGRRQRRALITALRTHLPWARVAGAWALLGVLCFSLAVGWMLLRRPGLLRGATLWQVAMDLTAAVQVPVTLLAALASVVFDWPLNLLVAVGLLGGAPVLLVASTAASGGVWVLDGWTSGVLVTPEEPGEEQPRFKATHYWALPPGRGRGRRLRDEGERLADRFGVVLELEAINPHLAHGMYRRTGFEIVAGSENRWRPAMRREPAGSSERTSPPLATGDRVRTSGL